MVFLETSNSKKIPAIRDFIFLIAVKL